MAGKPNIRETAHFLRENPRFFNEPICTIEDESVSTVADCLEWNVLTRSPSNASSSRKTSFSSNPQKITQNDIICHKLPIQGGNQAKSVLIKGILDPEHYTNGTDFKERMSFYNQYNCRIDPSEPTKGKLHGSFVWDVQDVEVSNSDSS